MNMINMTPTITYDDFLKVNLRVGTIIAVDDFPQARKQAYKLKIDLGSELEKKMEGGKSLTSTPKNN